MSNIYQVDSQIYDLLTIPESEIVGEDKALNEEIARLTVRKKNCLNKKNVSNYKKRLTLYPKSGIMKIEKIQGGANNDFEK